MTTEDILAALPKLRMLVIGDLMLDHYVWGDVHRISPEAPVPVVHAARDSHTAGGAANVALNLASLGAQVSLIGMLGQDAHADTLLDLLEKHRIDTSACPRNPQVPTIVKTRVIVRTQQLCRIDREAPRSTYGPSLDAEALAVLEARIATADAIIVSDYAKGFITQELMDRILELARQHRKFIAVDPKPSRQLDFRAADLITPNRHEALELAGLPEPCFGEAYPLEEACRRIFERYRPHTMVITLGADGMAVCREAKILGTLPTKAKEVYDVSGAGDTVIATLTAAMAAGADPLSGAAFANLAAGVVVSKVGTATPLPEELLAI